MKPEVQDRVETAKRLLRETTLSFHLVAARSGYASDSGLRGPFKTLTGMTLKQYRDQYRFDPLPVLNHYRVSKTIVIQARHQHHHEGTDNRLTDWVDLAHPGDRVSRMVVERLSLVHDASGTERPLYFPEDYRSRIADQVEVDDIVSGYNVAFGWSDADDTFRAAVIDPEGSKYGTYYPHGYTVKAEVVLDFNGPGD